MSKVTVINTFQRGGLGTAQFAITEDADVQAAYTVVADLTARNNLPVWKRLPYMRVYTTATNQEFRLGSDITLGGQVWTLVESFSSYQLLSEKNQPNGYVGLQSNGKINPAFIENIYANASYVTANTTTRNALTTLTGDIIITTDDSKIWVKLNNNPPINVSGDFAELLFPGLVLSVNGMTGAVSVTIANLLLYGSGTTDFNNQVAIAPAVTSLNSITGTHTTNISTLFTQVSNVQTYTETHIGQATLNTTAANPTGAEIGYSLIWNGTEYILSNISGGGGGFTNPMTTLGDLILGGASGFPNRLAIGANTYVLTSNGTTASWQPGGGGHVIKNNGTSLTQRANLNILNGLTASDNTPDTNIKFGGALVDAVTNITGAVGTKQLHLGIEDDELLSFTVEAKATAANISFINTASAGSVYNTFLMDSNGQKLRATDAGANESYVSVNKNLLQLYNAITYGTGFTTIKLDASNLWTQISGSTGFKGAVYLADYSANYTTRSLIDKGYADSRYALASGAMVYPGAGIALSTGSAWGTSITDNSANWNTAYTNRITSLTTTGTSGASTLISNTLNIPTYTLAGLGGQPLNTNLTSLSGLSFASTSFVKMTSAGTFALDTNTYLTSLSGAWLLASGGTLTGTNSVAMATFNLALTNGRVLMAPTGTTIDTNARLHIKSVGATSNKAFYVENSAGTNLITLNENGNHTIGSVTGSPDAFLSAGTWYINNGLAVGKVSGRTYAFEVVGKVKVEYPTAGTIVWQISDYSQIAHTITMQGLSQNFYVISGSITGVNLDYNLMYLAPTINQTFGTSTVVGYRYQPALTNVAGTTNHYAFISSAGRHGFGTITPTAKVHVKSDGTTTGVAFKVDDSAGTERFSILDNGTGLFANILGVGVTPTYALHVKGTSANQNLFVVQEDGGTNLIEAKESAGVNQLGFFAATPVAKPAAVTTPQGIADALTSLGLLTSSTIAGGGGGDMLLGTIQTVTALKTFNTGTFALRNPGNTFSYNFLGTAIVANRTVTLPLLTGDDEFVMKDFTQTLTNKTLSTGVVYNGGVIAGQYGGTGVANTGFTITLAGNLVTTGAFNTTFAQAATTTVTLPSTSSTMARIDAGQTFTGIQTFSTAIASTSGGTGFGTTAIGDLLQGDATNTWAKLASVSAGSFLRSGGVTTASTWSTVKLPDTMSALGIWVANSANTTVNLTATAGQSIRVNGGGTAWEAFTPSGTGDMVLATAQTSTAKKTFSVTGNIAGINIGANATDPTTTLAAGDIYYQSGVGVRIYSGSAWSTLGGGGIAGHVIQNYTTGLTQRANLNFTGGLSAVDNAGNTSSDVSLGGILSATVTTLSLNAASKSIEITNGGSDYFRNERNASDNFNTSGYYSNPLNAGDFQVTTINYATAYFSILTALGAQSFFDLNQGYFDLSAANAAGFGSRLKATGPSLVLTQGATGRFFGEAADYTASYVARSYVTKSYVDIGSVEIAPAADKTLVAGFAFYISSEYEVVDTYTLDIGSGAVLEVG
jgi:hypothetical protein